MRTQARIAVLAGIEIIGALICAGCRTYAQPRRPSPSVVPNTANVRVPFTGPTGDPPVKIVGGSMTFRSGSAWSTSDNVTYYASVTSAPSVLQFEHVALKAAPTETIGSLETIANIQEAWKIEVDARDDSGTVANINGNGVYVCEDPACNLSNSYGGKIYIMPIHSSANVGFYASSLDPVYPYFGRRYKDQTPSNPGMCSWGGFCEHIFQITVTFQSGGAITYTCPDGECRVYIGP